MQHEHDLTLDERRLVQCYLDPEFSLFDLCDEFNLRIPELTEKLAALSPSSPTAVQMKTRRKNPAILAGLRGRHWLLSALF